MIWGIIKTALLIISIVLNIVLIIWLIVEKNKYEDKKTYSANTVISKFILFMFQQDKLKAIKLGRVDGQVYIHFTNEELKKLLMEWFNLLLLKKNGEFTDESYDEFIQRQIEKYESTEQENSNKIKGCMTLYLDEKRKDDKKCKKQKK